MSDLEKLWARSEAGRKQVKHDRAKALVYARVESKLPKAQPTVRPAMTLAQLLG